MSDEHTLADELHPCVMDLARVHHILDQVVDIVGAFTSPHVELEPSNVIISPADSVWIRHGSPAARVPWAAPETLRDGTLTFRSNIYSVGAMLDAMLANRPGLPDAARRLVTWCTTASANGRPQTFAIVREHLRVLHWWRSARADQWYRRFVAKDDRERTLIEALRKTPGDDATRSVYADWLEENGDAERAGFLRRLDSEPGVALEKHTSWRAIVSRASIVGCGHKQCPARWHALQICDGIDNRRACETCKQTVDYCASLEEAENHGRAHAPIALDAMLPQDEAISAFGRGRMPIPTHTYNPPPPPPPPETLPPPGNPPGPGYHADVPEERNVLARFFGWLRRR